MVTKTIEAVLDDGPRAGQALQARARSDGSPPTKLAVRDPLDPRREQRDQTHAVLPHATIYRLHERRGPARFAYRTGTSDDSDQH